MEMRRDLCPFSPQIIQFGLYELPEPGRLEFLIRPKQKVLLFSAATVRHRDRKQILIIVWTHQEKKRKTPVGHNQMSQRRSLQTRRPFVSASPFPGTPLIS